MEFVDIHAETILEKPEDLKVETLQFILKSDGLNISESSLPALLVKWGTAEAKRQKRETKDAKEVRAILEDTGLFKLIRFPCMDLSEVASKVTVTGLLSEMELLDLFTYLSAHGTGVKVPVPESLKKFSMKPRERRTEADTSWMLTSDSHKGFRALPSPSGTPRFWLCVSKLNVFDAKKKYDPPKGYEWAQSEMWNSATVLSSSSDYNYFNQGGWASYVWEGVSRQAFLFQDSPTTRRIVHAGNYPTMSGFQITDITSTPFAGIVVIKKGSWDATSKTFKA